MTKDEALRKIATVNAMDYEYQQWAREALAQPEQEVSIEVLRAITNAGLTLLKKQHGYELRKLGPVIAHIKENT